MTIDYEPGRDLTMSFATPIARMRVKEAAEINPALQNLILENEAAQANDQRDNSGGWQSADDILDWPAPGLTVLKESIRDAITQMTKLTLGAETFDGRLILAALVPVLLEVLDVFVRARARDLGLAAGAASFSARTNAGPRTSAADDATRLETSAPRFDDLPDAASFVASTDAVASGGG